MGRKTANPAASLLRPCLHGGRAGAAITLCTPFMAPAFQFCPAIDHEALHPARLVPLPGSEGGR
jgi:hypothetical protein